jgi:MFS family permease
VQRTYLALVLLTTLAASLIWGINTLFLLDAGLSNLEAFAANAFYTAGMVLFEVPTGVVADVRGRRLSFLLGAATLSVGTLLYVLLWQVQAPFAGWALVSVVLGLGYTFFSGATEAWVVDALHASGFDGTLETVFGRAQAVQGGAMLVGSVGGGVLAQATSLGVPFVLRAVLLAVTFAVAVAFMRDWGWTRVVGESPLGEVRRVLDDSLRYGLGRAEVRWVMLAAPFVAGVEVYAFYAMQPYLLELYGDQEAYAVAGLAAAIVAGAQVVGGLAAPRVLRRVRRRTSVLVTATAGAALALLAAGLVSAFASVVVLLVAWALAAAVALPVRRSYLNALIPGQQRATVLSFDSLLGSAGGVLVQPALGRVADVSGYAPTFVLSGLVQLAAVPLLLLARRVHPPEDDTRLAAATAGKPGPDPARGYDRGPT